MVRYNNRAVAACLLMTTCLSSSYFGGGMAVARAHEETEVHDEYDDHTHDEESATTTTTADTATRVAGGGDDGNNVKDPSWSYLHATTLPYPLSDVSIAKMKTHEGQLVIVLTGGCNSPNGNELVMEEWGEGFSCKNITSQALAFVPKRVDGDSASSGLWSGTFTSLPDMPRPRYRHGSATINDDGSTLCVIGGRGDANDEMIAEIDCYNSHTQSWYTPSSLPNDYLVSDLAAFAYAPPGSGDDNDGDDDDDDDEEGMMVIVGGYTGPYMATENVTLVKYTLSDNGDITDVTYTDGPRLIGKRGDVDVAIVSDYVYVSGGFTHEDEFAMPKNTVERIALIDLLSSSSSDNSETTTTTVTTWSNVDSLNQERGDKQLVGLNGRVYAMGGETKIDGSGMDAAPEVWGRSEVLDTVEVYDPNADVHGGLAEWRVLSDMPAQIFRFAAIDWQPNKDETGVIFVFGGQVGYDADDCKCFRTTDKVMVLDVELAKLEMMNGAASSSASSTLTGLFISVVAFAFAGIVLCLAM